MWIVIVAAFIAFGLVVPVWLVARTVRLRGAFQKTEAAKDEQNLHTRYSCGEFSPEEYRGRLRALGSPASVLK